MRPADNGLSSPSGEEYGSGKDLRLSMVLGDAELELFDSIELIASLSYLLQVRACACPVLSATCFKFSVSRWLFGWECASPHVLHEFCDLGACWRTPLSC
jgi:hypothetical protein